jgi:hypothetical protein
LSLKIFKSARAALEASRGTDTPPTKALEFEEAFHQQEVATIRPLTLAGSYFGYRSATAGTESNTLEMSGALSYDMAIWLANTHIKAVPAGVKGVGVDYLWQFLPTSASDDIKSASVQMAYSDGLGAGQPGVKLTYCVGDELGISWDKGGDGTVQYTSKMVSPKAATQLSAFTGSAAAIGSTYVASANTTVVTVDTTTIGSTQDDYWANFSWTLSNNFRSLFTLNATTAAIATFRPGARTWKLEGSRYYQSSTEWNAFVAKTPRKIRIRSIGPVVGSSTYWINLDLYGVYTGMTWNENDDLGFQTFTLEPIYDSGATTDFLFTVTSAVTAIT